MVKDDLRVGVTRGVVTTGAEDQSPGTNRSRFSSSSRCCDGDLGSVDEAELAEDAAHVGLSSDNAGGVKRARTLSRRGPRDARPRTPMSASAGDLPSAPYVGDPTRRVSQRQGTGPDPAGLSLCSVLADGYENSHDAYRRVARTAPKAKDLSRRAASHSSGGDPATSSPDPPTTSTRAKRSGSTQSPGGTSPPLDCVPVRGVPGWHTRGRAREHRQFRSS